MRFVLLAVVLVLMSSVCYGQTVYVQPAPIYHSTTPMYSLPNGGYYYYPPTIHYYVVPRYTPPTIWVQPPPRAYRQGPLGLLWWRVQ